MVPPVSFEEVKAVIERELKRPLSEIFAEFDEKSIAAASVGQVHIAKLYSGEKVAVKIIRPGIDRRIKDDLRLMYFLAGKAEKALEIGRVIGATNLVREFERNIIRELDMMIEAGSIEKFARNFEEVEEIYIPKVHWGYTTRSVLVMEHIEGIKMDHVDEIRAAGIDPNEVAMIGLRSFSRQLMLYGFFHADPHPGNTIVMYDGRVSLVDFGITGYLDEETMRQIANLFLGYAEHDYNMIMDALMDAGLINEDMDLKAFRVDLKDVSESFYGRSLRHISVRDVYDQMMDLVLKYHVRLPRNLLLLLKTFIQTEALGKILGSDASILEVTRPFAKKLLQRGLNTQSMLRNLDREGRKLSGYTRSIPKHLNDILRADRGGQAADRSGPHRLRRGPHPGRKKRKPADGRDNSRGVHHSRRDDPEFRPENPGIYLRLSRLPVRLAHGNPGSNRIRGRYPSRDLADCLDPEVGETLKVWRKIWIRRFF